MSVERTRECVMNVVGLQLKSGCIVGNISITRKLKRSLETGDRNWFIEIIMMRFYMPLYIF